MHKLHTDINMRYSENLGTQDTSLVSNLFELALEEEKAVRINKKIGSCFQPRPMDERDESLSEFFPKVSLKNFKRIKFLGKGAYGTVDLVRCNLDNQYYALKKLDKYEISRLNKIPHLMREKDLMNKCKHHNIVRLENTFQDDDSCYFVLEYHPIGDLASLIKKNKKLSRPLTRFYAKEIINALEYLRKHNIVHRDLKPENILIDENFHCKISDFGAAK